MARDPLFDPRQYHSWISDPSTRESIRPFTQRKPIDITLATPGTAENIITVSPGLATVNLVTNPSCEDGDPPTGYTAVDSATLSQDGTYYLYGSYSLKIVSPGAVAGEGAYWNIGTVAKDEPIAVSAYFEDAAASGDGVRVELVVSSATSAVVGTISNARLAVGNTVALSATPTRSILVSPPDRSLLVFHITSPSAAFDEDEVITGATSTETAIVRTVQTTTSPYYLVVEFPSGKFECDKGIRKTETIAGTGSGSTATLQSTERIILNNNTLHLYMVTATTHSTTFYVDAVQAEIQDSVTSYCDGSRGWMNWWGGVAHQSVSRRWRSMSSIRSMRLHASRDLYIAYDREASNSSAINAEDRGELIRAGSDFGENHPIFLTSKISFINRLSGERPRLTGNVEGC